ASGSARHAGREGVPPRRPPQLPRAPAAAGGRRNYESRVDRGPGAAVGPLPASPPLVALPGHPTAELPRAAARRGELEEEEPAHDHHEVEQDAGDCVADDAERAAGKGCYRDHGRAEGQGRREPLDPVLADEAVALDAELGRRVPPAVDELGDGVE